MVPTRPEVGCWGFLSLVLGQGEAREVTSPECLARLPQITNTSLGLAPVINHPSQFSIWVPVLVLRWCTAAAARRRSWQLACSKGKKPNFECIPDFPLIPLEGGSLKVILLQFLWTRICPFQTFTGSTLHSLITGEKEPGTY